MGNNPSVSSTPKMPIAEELLRHIPARLTGLHPIAVDYPGTIKRPFEECPNVPWNLLPMDKYRAHNWHCLDALDKKSPYAVLYTSLNCPFDCFYCNVHTLYGDRQIRHRPMKDIFADLTFFAKQGIRNIKIWDELFCLDRYRVERICDFIVSLGFDFNIWAYARLDIVMSKMLIKMKQAGINWVAYGFETASDKKSKVSRKAIDMTREAGINIIANFMFGLPGETLCGMQDSLDMAIQENFEYVNFNVALPYPGSAWYASLKDKPTDWARFNQFSPKNLNPEVARFRNMAFETYFNRPEYLFMIKAKFGEKAEAHIKEMVKWKIR